MCLNLHENQYRIHFQLKGQRLWSRIRYQVENKTAQQTFISFWPHKIMPFFFHIFERQFLYWYSDPCQAASCRHHSACKLKPDGSTACECPLAEECPDVNDPVCGTNGKTYESECKLKAESCAEGSDVTTKHNGVCGMKITSQNVLSLTCSLYRYYYVLCCFLQTPARCRIARIIMVNVP